MLFLADNPMAELLKTLDDERDSAGVGPFLQRFLPFFFVVAGIGAVERGGINTDSIVQVGVEDAVWRLWVPLGVDEFDLVCHGLLTCTILLVAEPIVELKGVGYEESYLVPSIFYFATARTDSLAEDLAAAVAAVHSVH